MARGLVIEEAKILVTHCEGLTCANEVSITEIWRLKVSPGSSETYNELTWPRNLLRLLANWATDSGGDCPFKITEPIVPAPSDPALTIGWNLVFPTSVHFKIETGGDPTNVLATVVYSSNNPLFLEHEFDNGMITVKATKERGGKPLPAPGFAMLQMPALTFRYTRTEPYSFWFGAINGVPDISGNMRQRVMACLGKVDSSGFLGSMLASYAGSGESVAGQWLFTGAKARLILNSACRVTYEFAWANFRALDENLCWQWQDNAGGLHDVRDEIDFSVLGLIWADESPL